jgi:hypothetical protein
MPFDPAAYGPRIAQIFAMDQNGERRMPLVGSGCSSPEALRHLEAEKASVLFAGARHPEEAMAGIWLYFSALDQAHHLVQDISSREGCYWHGILHRQEPDAGNSAYWFRKVGRHTIHRDLTKRANEIVKAYTNAEFRPSHPWDPFGFIMLCERARRQPRSESELAAIEIQRAEWELLFDHCAKGKH